jgi:hypothetical protein
VIVLLILLALIFAWAVIATAVAVSHSMTVTLLQGMLTKRDSELVELRDRFQASSLSEFHAARAITMQPSEPEPVVRYVTDDTGLIRFPAEPDDDDL